MLQQPMAAVLISSLLWEKTIYPGVQAQHIIQVTTIYHSPQVPIYQASPKKE